MGLQQHLPALVAAAISWGKHHEALILRTGRGLTPGEYALARAVGVRQPEQVRVVYVPTIPLPEDTLLRGASLQSGAVSAKHTHGLTLGYGIYLVTQHANEERLVSHQLRHVHQYEMLGGLEWFMAIYVPQVVVQGYTNAPLERDARAAEVA